MTLTGTPSQMSTLTKWGIGVGALLLIGGVGAVINPQPAPVVAPAAAAPVTKPLAPVTKPLAPVAKNLEPVVDAEAEALKVKAAELVAEQARTNELTQLRLLAQGWRDLTEPQQASVCAEFASDADQAYNDLVEPMSMIEASTFTRPVVIHYFAGMCV